MNSITNKQKRPGPIVLDVAGLVLGPDDVRRIVHPLTGGVILFARNFESRAQLTALTAAIRAIRDDVLICIDHEGGRVQRAKQDGFTHLPAMSALGQLWDATSWPPRARPPRAAMCWRRNCAAATST